MSHDLHVTCRPSTGAAHVTCQAKIGDTSVTLTRFSIDKNQKGKTPDKESKSKPNAPASHNPILRSKQ